MSSKRCFFGSGTERWRLCSNSLLQSPDWFSSHQCSKHQTYLGSCEYLSKKNCAILNMPTNPLCVEFESAQQSRLSDFRASLCKRCFPYSNIFFSFFSPDSSPTVPVRGSYPTRDWSMSISARHRCPLTRPCSPPGRPRVSSRGWRGAPVPVHPREVWDTVNW